MKRKVKLSNIVLPLFFTVLMLIGISTVFYPYFSSWWNKRAQTRVIEHYEHSVGKLDADEKEKIFAQARDYNTSLISLNDPTKDYDEVADYSAILDITGTGIIGYIDIPKIDVHLPIYHGTSPEVLNIAVGHMQGSTFPVGGLGTHSVISAHSGLPSAKLFTNIDQLTEDDRFSISILDEVLTYEVEGTAVVLPSESELIQPVPGKDLVTLLTCTPYGINTHRLLVRAHRIDVGADDDTSNKVRIPNDAILIDNTTSIPFIVIPLIIILLIYWILKGKQKTKRFFSAYTCKKNIDPTTRDLSDCTLDKSSKE